MKSRTRPFILLEVLIALAIVSLCLVPLLGVHGFILRGELSIVQELQLDREVSRLQQRNVRALYRGEIGWNEIEQKIPLPAGDAKIEALGFEGIRYFVVEKGKPKGAPEVYMVAMHHEFRRTGDTEYLWKYRYPIVIDRRGAL